MIFEKEKEKAKARAEADTSKRIKTKRMSEAQMCALVSSICMYDGEYTHAIIKAVEKFHNIGDVT